MCSRLGIDTPAAAYLANYCDSNHETPPISLDCIMKAAGLIESMSRERLPARKEKTG